MQGDLIAIDIQEAARRLSISPRTVAVLIAKRELPSRKVGRRRIIPVVALEAYVRGDRDQGRSSSAKSLRRSTAIKG
jgi:excisionase family DNA binding protein